MILEQTEAVRERHGFCSSLQGPPSYPLTHHINVLQIFHLPLGAYFSVCHPHSGSHHSNLNCAKIGKVILNHNHDLSLVLKNINYFHTLSLFFEAVNHLTLSCD